MIFLAALFFITLMFFSMHFVASPESKLGGTDQPPKSLTGTIESLILLLSASIMAIVVGLRRDTGLDYESYHAIFERFRDQPDVLFLEPGYSGINLLAHNIGASFNSVLFASAAISSFVAFWVISRESPRPYFSILILFGLGFFFLQTNLVRQSIAMSISFAALPLIWSRQLRWYTSAIALASLFHYTALILWPFYWLARWRLPIPVLAALVVLVLALMTQPNLYLPLLRDSLSLLTPGHYSHYVDMAFERPGAVRSGAVILIYGGVILVTLLFLIADRPIDIRTRVLMNLVVYGFVINTLLGPLWAVSRLAGYFEIAAALFFPYAVKFAKTPSDRYLCMLTISGYFLARFVLGLLSGTHGATPYRSVLFQ